MAQNRRKSSLHSFLHNTDLAIAASLFVALLAVYTFTTSGLLHSNDELGILAVTESLVKRGAFDANLASNLYMGRGDSIVLPGSGGNYYTVKGVTPSLLAAPFYALALRLPPDFNITRVTLLASPTMSALTVALFFCLILNLGYSRRVSSIAALTLGLATPLWAYAETLYSETAAVLTLVLTLLLIDTALRRGAWLPAALAGVACGAMVASALPLSLLVPILGAYVIYRLATQDERGLWQALRHPGLLAFAGGIGLAAAALAAYNTLRFGSATMGLIADPTYLWEWRNVPIAVPGLLTHLDRGLLPHVPLFLLLPWGMWFGWQQHRPESLLGPLGLLTLLFFYGTFNQWASGVSWGPRFLVPLLPLLCMALLPILVDSLTNRRTGALILLGVLAAVSLYTQMLGAVTDWVSVVSNLIGRFTPVPGLSAKRLPHTARDWVGLSQLAAARDFPLDMWWANHPMQPGPWLLLAVSAASLIGAVLLLRNQTSSRAHRLLWGLVGGGLAAWIAVVPGYARLSEPRFGPALDYVSAQARPDDVLMVVGFSPEEFLREYRGRWRAYSTRIHGFPLPSDAQGVVDRAHDSAPRLWVLSTLFAPADPGNGVDRWLSENAYKGPIAWQGDALVTLYGTVSNLGEPQSISAVWEDTFTLESFAYAGQSHSPGQVISIDLLWHALVKPEVNYTFFLHLLDSDGVLVAQTDYQPCGGYCPTATWERGEFIHDRVGLNLPDETLPGTYQLRAGIVNPDTNARLPVTVTSPPFEGDTLLLGEIHVQG